MGLYLVHLVTDWQLYSQLRDMAEVLQGLIGRVSKRGAHMLKGTISSCMKSIVAMRWQVMTLRVPLLDLE